jgi:aldehyde:ferredoxin oxidoreductase
MECAERGLLDAPWLRFGDGAAMLQALEEIGSARLREMIDGYYAIRGLDPQGRPDDDALADLRLGEAPL